MVRGKHPHWFNSSLFVAVVNCLAEQTILAVNRSYECQQNGPQMLSCAHWAKSFSAVSSCSQELCSEYTSDPSHSSVVPLHKKTQNAAPDFTKETHNSPERLQEIFKKPCVLNPVGLQHVNHGLNILAHLASWREINDMSNLYNNPPKMKELSNKSTCATTLI